MKTKSYFWIIGILVVFGVLVWALSGNEIEITGDLIPVESIHEGNSGNHLHGMGYDSTNEKLYLATHSGLYVLKNDENLFWVEGIRDDFMGFSLNQNNPNIIYTSGHPFGGGNAGVMKTADFGKTWERVFTNTGVGSVDFHSMTISLADENVLAGYYQGNFYVTENAGETWRTSSQTPPPGPCWGAPCLAADSQERERIYTGTNQGLYVTNDLGESWELVSREGLAGVVVHPENNNILYAHSSQGIVKSEDFGKTWESKNQGVSLAGNEMIFAFSFDVTNPETIYAATTGQKVFKTEDAGDSWMRVL